MHTTTLDIRSTCRIIPGLSREQLNLCYKANDVTIAALDGLDLAMHECQLQVINQAHAFVSMVSISLKFGLPHTLKPMRIYILSLIYESCILCSFLFFYMQFQWHRWNCSSLNPKKRNPHTSNLLKKGKTSADCFH